MGELTTEILKAILKSKREGYLPCPSCGTSLDIMCDAEVAPIEDVKALGYLREVKAVFLVRAEDSQQGIIDGDVQPVGSKSKSQR